MNVGLRYHLICGLHSNIPYCCIVWWLFYKSTPLWFKTVYSNFLKKRSDNKYTYILCPICALRKHFVSINSCTCRDAPLSKGNRPPIPFPRDAILLNGGPIYMILKCSCKNEHQDKLHGKGRRVHNKTAKGSYRCTVCKTEKS